MTRPVRLINAALALFFGVTVVVLAAFVIFAQHPERALHLSGAATAYMTALRLLPAAQIAVGAIALAVALVATAGARWVPAFIAVYGLSLASELLGTGYGIPFGPYRYSALLGPTWSGRVPFVIPLSWFLMAVPAYALARGALGPARRWVASLVAALLLVAWDVSLDPAMSRATAYWTWGTAGAYYGMPWSNLVGWSLTGLAIMIVLAALGADQWATRVPVRWMAGYYGVTLLLPLGMCAAAGLWLAVGATAAIGVGCVIALYLVRGGQPVPHVARPKRGGHGRAAAGAT